MTSPNDTKQTSGLIKLSVLSTLEELDPRGASPKGTDWRRRINETECFADMPGVALWLQYITPQAKQHVFKLTNESIRVVDPGC